MKASEMMELLSKFPADTKLYFLSEFDNDWSWSRTPKYDPTTQTLKISI